MFAKVIKDLVKEKREKKKKIEKGPGQRFGPE
jgi:hypothetical protein